MNKYVRLPNDSIEIYDIDPDPENSPCCGENRTEWRLLAITKWENLPIVVQEKLKNQRAVEFI